MLGEIDTNVKAYIVSLRNRVGRVYATKEVVSQELFLLLLLKLSQVGVMILL